MCQISPRVADRATDILIDTKDKIQKLYNLTLRIGIVPVKDLLQAGKTLQMAKLAVSQYYDQAILSGSAVDTAEAWVKKEGSSYLAATKTDAGVQASFLGFTCRWQDVKSSDYCKFDGTLKMVLSVPSDAREEIHEFLEKEFNSGHIFYGTHVSDRALLTCLVHVESIREVHFVDAADGGYALAAQKMKKQILAQS